MKLDEKSMALVVGAYVADPKPLDAAVKNYAKLAESQPDLPKVKFDATSHDGIRFHTASIPVPADRKIAKVLGEQLEVSVGIGENAGVVNSGALAPISTRSRSKSIAPQFVSVNVLLTGCPIAVAPKSIAGGSTQSAERVPFAVKMIGTKPSSGSSDITR